MLSPADRLVVEQDRALPGLATVLDEEAALALVGIDAQTDPPVRREPWFKLPWRK